MSYGGMNTTGGDIWSTGAFSFESPLKDLLDSGVYSVEQLLNEDELLQEIRSRNEIILNFLSTDESITKLLYYIFFSKSNSIQQKSISATTEPSTSTLASTLSETNADNEQKKTTITTITNGKHDETLSVLSGTDHIGNHDTTVDDIGKIQDVLNGKQQKEDVILPFNNNTTQNTTPKLQEPGEWIREHILEDVIVNNDSTKLDIHSNTGTSQQSQQRDYQEQHDESNLYTTEITTIRFPYIACEIICCEIPSILDRLVNGNVVFPYGTVESTTTAVDSPDDTAPLATTGSIATTTTTVLDTNNEIEGVVSIDLEDDENIDDDDNNNNNNNNNDTTSNRSNSIIPTTEIVTTNDSDDVEVISSSLSLSLSSSSSSSSSNNGGNINNNSYDNDDDTNTNIVVASATAALSTSLDVATAAAVAATTYTNADLAIVSNTTSTSLLVPEQSTTTSKDYTNTLLDYLFSVLFHTLPGQLDDYRAGYFDKILTVLFRNKPDEVTTYINTNHCFSYTSTINDSSSGSGSGSGSDSDSGSSNTSIMRALLQHLYSPSIMQIAQRLLIPPKPAGKITDGSNNNNNNMDGGIDHDINNNNNMNIDDNMVGDELIITGAEDDDDDMGCNGTTGNEFGGRVRCDWYNSTEAIALLLDMLTGDDDNHNSSTATTGGSLTNEEQILDISLNASEVLITIIQNSMLSSKTMLTLTQSNIVLRIITAATTLRNTDNNYFSPHETLLTSAMNVLESLILQLGGYGAVGTMSLLPVDSNVTDPTNNNDHVPDSLFNNDSHEQQYGNNNMIDLIDPTNVNNNNNNNNNNLDSVDEFQSDSCDENDENYNNDQEMMSIQQQQHEQQLQVNSQDETVCMDDDVNMDDDDDKHLIADLRSILEHLQFMLDNFTNLLVHPSTKTWKSPMQYSNNTTGGEQLLGNSRLRIIRVIESLVLLGDPDIDSILVQQSSCLEICLNFFWQFQWCSMLHQSVANLLVHVFEGQNTRYEMQEFFLYKCNLLGGLMSSFTTSSTSITTTTTTTMILDNNDNNNYNNTTDENDTEIVNQGLNEPEMVSPITPVESQGQPNDVTLPLVTEQQEEGNNVEDEVIGIEDVSDEIDSKLAQLSLSEEGNDTSPLPVSEDDVDAAMEDDDDERVVDVNQENTTTSTVQTVAVVPLKEMSIEVDDNAVQYNTHITIPFAETCIDNDAIPLAQSFRCGYMGHVIIICQALVNAYMHDDPQHRDTGTPLMQDGHDAHQHQQHGMMDGVVSNHQYDGVDGTTSHEEDMYTGPKDDFGDPLLLADLVSQHPVADRWHEFVVTTLASENAIQSTPQGSYHNSSSLLNDPMMAHRPGLIDAGYMNGDDGEGPPAPPNRGIMSSGIGGALILHESGDDIIDMDDNDLEIAAGMMAGLSISHSTSNNSRGNSVSLRKHRMPHNDFASSSIDDRKNYDDTSSYGSNSGDSEKSYNSGETANDRSTGYAFDDPLGKADGLGIELGKLTQYDTSTSSTSSLLLSTRRKKKSSKKQKKSKKQVQPISDESAEVYDAAVVDKNDNNDDSDNDDGDNVLNNTNSDDGSHSSASSDDDDDDDESNSDDKKEFDDVPVMDLFAGNFTFNEIDGATLPAAMVPNIHNPFSLSTTSIIEGNEVAAIDDFADFANFDNADMTFDMNTTEFASSLETANDDDFTAEDGVVFDKPNSDIDDDFGPFSTKSTIVTTTDTTTTNHRLPADDDENDADIVETTTSISFDSPDAVSIEYPTNTINDPIPDVNDIFGDGPKDHLSLLEEEDDEIQDNKIPSSTIAAETITTTTTTAAASLLDCTTIDNSNPTIEADDLINTMAA